MKILRYPAATAVISYMLLFPCVIVSSDSTQQRLVRDLLSHYDPKLRPVYRHTDTVEVNVHLKLSRILDISYKDSTARIGLTLTLEWTDGELEWNSQKYGDLSQVVLPANSVWVPDTSLVNRKDKTSDLTKENTFVRVHESGRVQWWTFQVVTVNFDKSKSEGTFPAETYEIPFQISTLPYSTAQLEIIGYANHTRVTDGHSVDISEFYLSTSWNVLGSTVNLTSVTYPCCAETYNLLTYTLKIKRKPNLYKFSNLIPLVILTCLPLLSFLIPVDSKQKIFFGVFCLVAFALLRQQLDSNAQHFYGNWHNFGIFLHFFILVANIGSINTYLNTGHMPEWFKRGMEHGSKLVLLEWPKNTAPDSPLVLETSLDAIERDSSINQLALHFKAKSEQDSAANYWQHSSRVLDRGFGTICTLISVVGVFIFASSYNSQRIQKRIAVLPSSPSTSLLVPISFHSLARGRTNSFNPNDEENQIDAFPTTATRNNPTNAVSSRGKVTFPSQTPLLVFRDRDPDPEPSTFRFPQEPPVRDGRNLLLEPKIPEPITPDIFNLTPATSAETGRKASPDVQDIIDGIVKLLGGKVHNTQSSAEPSNAPPQAGSQLISSHRPYNLFNPTKPIFYPTAKPARINNRGPVLTVPQGGNNKHSGEQLQLQQHQQQQQYEQQQQQQQQPVQHFEAIPLEVLSNNYNLTQTKFGPPFSLTHHHAPSHQHEAPYKQGVPLPVQVVPGSHVGNPTNFNSNWPQKGDSATNYYPLSSAELQNYNNNRQRIPLAPVQDNGGNNGGNNGQLPPQPRPSNDGPRPPTQYYTNGQNTPNNSGGKQYQGFQNQNQPNPALAPRPPLTATSLLVPVSKGTSPLPPLQAQLHTSSVEDDELEAEKALGQGLDKGTRKPYGLEPTVNEESQLPAFIFESTASVGSKPTTSFTSTSTSTVYQFSSMASSSVTIASIPKINPTSSSSFSATAFTSTLEWDDGSTTATTIIPAVTPAAPVTLTPTHPKTPAYNPNNIGFGTSTSLGSISTPPLRPGIVIHEDGPGVNPIQHRPVAGRPQGYGSVEVVTSDDQHNNYGVGKPGDVFDITVTAKQNYGGQATGQPFVIPVDIKDEIITAPNGNQQFVSIDGKRTYFNLHPSTAIGGPLPSPATPAIVAHVQGTIPPAAPIPPVIKSHPGIVGAPSHPFAPSGSGNNKNTPSRAVSTSLSITGNGGTVPGGNLNVGTTLKINDRPGAPKTPLNIIRRPLNRRPSVPPVRIDTCIVGDDSTCNSEQYESCRTEHGVSSCLCRPGYARKRHREPCKAVVSLVLSIRLDKLGDKKLSYNPDYFNPNSETYQTLEYETIHGLDSAISDTTLQSSYIGAKLDAIGFDGRHAVVNSTVLLQENPKLQNTQVKREIQRQLIDVLTKNRNNFGKSQLWVEGPISAINAIADLDECSNPELNDCDHKADCVNTYGSFECKCHAGYGDRFEKDKRRSGRACESCNGKTHCNGRGECLIENGQNVCKCAGNYYGSQCDIDGEVLAVAIGASVSALVIIGLTLACLCMWSRRWKREEQKAAIMSRTLFGGMATQALSYLSKNNPYQQHVTMDERLRWAQVTDPNLNGNIYVNEPMSLHASPTMMGASLMDTPPMMSARRSADTCDTTIDDLFEDRHHMNKRPKSRSSQSQLQTGSIYYDLEGDHQNEIYATRQPNLVPYPAQFCVPMNPYPHSRGFYN